MAQRRDYASRLYKDLEKIEVFFFLTLKNFPLWTVRLIGYML